MVIIIIEMLNLIFFMRKGEEKFEGSGSSGKD